MSAVLRRVRETSLLASVLAVAACSTGPATPTVPGTGPTPYVPSPGPAAPPPSPSDALSPAVLPGWNDEDHLAAFRAYLDGCGAARDAAARGVCGQAKTMAATTSVTPSSARAFFEANFSAVPAAAADGRPGLLTAYFAPEYPARRVPDDEFSAPVLPKPADPRGAGDRAMVESNARPDQALAWMRAEDLFFLQIQGSGVLVLPDGTRKRAAFAAHNGRPFVGIARPMRERGLLKDSDTSGDAIRRWLAEHRGPEADEIMRLNPRYVFFRMSDDDGKEATGAAGVPLPAGRAIAVDLSRHAVGELFWIDASAPILTGAFPTYRRLTVALDTGGAIKGEVRADLYMGSGDAAGVEAGRVRHTLRMWRLIPVASGG